MKTLTALLIFSVIYCAILYIFYKTLVRQKSNYNNQFYKWLLGIKVRAYSECNEADSAKQKVEKERKKVQGQSDSRRFLSRFILLISSFIIYVAFVSSLAPDLFAVNSTKLGAFSAGGLCIAALIFFIPVVLIMPFNERSTLKDKENYVFSVNVRRLFGDAIISSFFTITAFGLFYYQTGLIYGGQHVYPTYLDAIYFSAVTFSTLGFGDFSPIQNFRIVASAQALIGNLHLGMIIGTTFVSLSSPSN